MKQEENNIYTIYCNSIPASGHSIPLLKIADALQKKGHNIIYATSYYQVPKIKEKFPKFTYVELQDRANEPGLKNQTKGPPLDYFYEPWLQGLRQSVQKYKPNVLFVDIFSVAAVQIAEEFQIKVVINAGLTLQSLVLFGLPDITKNIGFFGLTVFEPNPFTLLFRRLSPLFAKLSRSIVNHLVIAHTFIGIDRPISIPPNIKMIGLGVDKSPPQQFPEDIRNWLANIEDRQLDIIYVTFGSHLVATQEFVNHLYYGLKKTGKAIIWGLKKNNIPQQNQLFLVKQWLPQRELLKLKQVKIVITHCGFGGMTETIEAEKPMLGMPVFGDQPFNAKRIEQLGIGITLRESPGSVPREYNSFGFTHEELIEKVNKLLSDPNYEVRIRKIKKLGEKYRGIQAGCDWVEYAVQYGYEHFVDKSLSKVVSRDPFTLVKTVFWGTVIGGLAYLGWRYGSKSIETIPPKNI